MNLDYIAGFFDGEGTATAVICRRPDMCYGFAIQPMIEIAQKYPDILNEIQQFLGFGHVDVTHVSLTQRTARMPCGRWRTTARDDCKRFIELIAPRSRLKGKQLQLLLTVIENGTRPRCGGMIPPIPKERLLRALDAVEQIHAINKGKRWACDLNQLHQHVIAFDMEAWKQRRFDVLRVATEHIIEASTRHALFSSRVV